MFKDTRQAVQKGAGNVGRGGGAAGAARSISLVLRGCCDSAASAAGPEGVGCGVVARGGAGKEGAGERRRAGEERDVSFTATAAERPGTLPGTEPAGRLGASIQCPCSLAQRAWGGGGQREALWLHAPQPASATPSTPLSLCHTEDPWLGWGWPQVASFSRRSQGLDYDPSGSRNATANAPVCRRKPYNVQGFIRNASRAKYVSLFGMKNYKFFALLSTQ